MRRHGDYLWPDADEDAHGVLLMAVEPDVSALLKHVKGRDVIVQAGGNVGLYPIALAKHFARVYTVEPDPDNYECLLANSTGRGLPLTSMRAAFGENTGACAMDRFNPANCGAHRIMQSEDGPIPVLEIDSLMLDACDAIWLDVEGYELPALRGAVNTILKFSPVIAVEEKGLGAHYGIGPDALPRFLAGLGYAETARHGNDRIYTRRMT